MSSGELAFELVSPLLLLWAARWFVGLARGFGHLLDNDNVGPTVVGSAFFGAVASVGMIGLWMLSVSTRNVVIESACPCCGARRRRAFADPKRSARPALCGECNAYLRSKGTEVSEEPSEALDLLILPYEIAPERYLSVAQRDNRKHFKFEMPAMCAVCGSPDAPQLRTIESGEVVLRTGVVAEVASIAAGEVARELLPHESRMHHRPPITTDTPSDQYDEALGHLKVPVCDQHTEAEDDRGNPIEYFSGRLTFASYRYYKAFCALNQISGKPSVTG